MGTNSDSAVETVMVLAGDHGELVCRVLRQAGFLCTAIDSMPELCDAIAREKAWAGVITQEMLKPPDAATLVDTLHRQPSWSEFPLIIIARQGVTRAPSLPKILSDLRVLRAATVVDRPLRIVTLASAAQMALRERRRQYERRAAAEREDLLRRLQAEHERMEVAQSAADLGVFEWYLDEDRLVISPNLESMLGLAPGSFDGRPESFWAVVDPQDAPHVKSEASRLTRPGYLDVEFRIIRPDGSLRWVYLRGRLASEGPRRIIGISMNISERKHAEQVLRDAQKLESIVTLASGVAHDFNNLLTAVLGNASLGEQLLPADHAVRPYLKHIISAVEAAAGLTGQLIAYAGKGQFVVEKLDLSALIAATSGLMRSALPRTVDLRFNLAGGLPFVEADRSQIEQVLMNLVINAGEAVVADPGGVVEVKTMKREDGAPAVCLEVKDNGPGIPAHVKPRIFDPFFSTKFPGRGLGLAAVAGIVRACHGEISVFSEPGQGATFRICLPACAESVRAAAQRPPIPKFAGLVLVVDDDEFVRDMLRSVFENYGFGVRLARNGGEALAIYDQNPRDIFLVVLDLMMPATGVETTLAELHARNPELPVLVSTDDPQTDLGRLSAVHSRLDILQKPFDIGRLTIQLRRLFGGGVGDLSVEERGF